MSQYFDMGNETLWNPSSGASRMFQRQVAVFEAELDLPSGIGPMENDECQVSPDTFEAFVNALLTKHRSASHFVWLALAEGFTVTVLVLAERGRDQGRLGTTRSRPRSPPRKRAGFHPRWHVCPSGRRNLGCGPAREGAGAGTAHALLTRATAYAEPITVLNRCSPP